MAFHYFVFFFWQFQLNLSILTETYFKRDYLIKKRLHTETLIPLPPRLDHEISRLPDMHLARNLIQFHALELLTKSNGKDGLLKFAQV